jgi:AP2 domain
MKNDYILNNGVIHIQINSPKYGTFFTKVSLNHLDRLKELDRSITVRYDHRMRGFYAAFKMNGKQVQFHRWITNAPEGTHVDHQNSNTLDNTDENLHVCSPTENKRKKRKNVTNTSGVIGVYWNKQHEKWKAQLRSLGKSYHVGYFDNLEEAAKAIEEKKKELWGYA